MSTPVWSILHMLEGWAAILGLLYGGITIGAGLHALKVPSPFGPRRPVSRRPPPRRVWYWIAAHDEAEVIGQTVRQVLALAPDARCEVVADACTDRTSDRAREAGARVHERNGQAGRGKWEALAWLHERLGPELEPDDVVILLDADNAIRPGAPEAWIEAWRDGHDVVQGVREAASFSGTSGPDGLAESIHHRIMAPGLVWWGVGPTLSGSGTAFSCGLLGHLLARTTSQVEDFEWQLTLAREGVVVGWAPEARVLDAKTATGPDLVRQRTRWIRGKWRLAWRTLTRICLSRGIPIQGRLRQLGWIILLPPRTWVALGLGAGNLQACLPGHAGEGFRMLVGLGGIGLGTHLLAGLAQPGFRPPDPGRIGCFVMDLVRATFLAIVLPGEQRWIRTRRETPSPPESKHRPRRAGEQGRSDR